MEALRIACQQASQEKILETSLDDWHFVKGPPPEGLIPFEEAPAKSHCRGVLGKYLLFSNEIITHFYSFDKDRQFLIGTVTAIFQEAVFLQESRQLVQVRFSGQKPTKKLVEKIEFNKKEFFPLSSTQLLRVEANHIALYVEGTYGFKQVWQVKRGQESAVCAPHSAKITKNSVLYIEGSDCDFRYYYFSLVNGNQTGPAKLPTPYIWPLSNGRVLSLLKGLNGFFLEIHYPNQEKKMLWKWQTFDEHAQVKWIDSNDDWVLLQVGNQIAAIQITLTKECFIGTFNSPNGGFLYLKDQVLLYSRHTLFIYQLPTLEHVQSIRLTTEPYYPEMDDFFIQDVRIISEGPVALVEGYANGKAICRYLRRVDMGQKTSSVVLSHINRVVVASPSSIPQEVKIHSLPSGGIAVTSPDYLISYVEEKVILSLPCKPLEVAGDWALVQVDNQLQMQCLSKFEQRRYPLPRFPFGATIVDDSLLIAGGGNLILYDKEGKQKARYKSPYEEPVIKAYASQDRLYLVTKGTQENLFWMHVYDRQQDYQFLERFYLSHREVCRVGDAILGVQKKENEYQYCLVGGKGSHRITFPYGDNFKWLGEDGTWAAATCGGKLYLMKGANLSEHHILGGVEGAFLLGKGLLARWRRQEVEISKIGDFKALQKVSTKHSIRGVFVRDATLLCVTQEGKDLSFETERFSLKLSLDTQFQKRSSPTYSQKYTLVALAAIALFTYYCYLQRQAKKPNAPSPLIPPPKPSTPPRRVPVRIRPPRQNVWRN